MRAAADRLSTSGRRNALFSDRYPQARAERYLNLDSG
jgi:hypothetical protein